MAIGDIALTAGMRNNLVSLQRINDLLNKTQEHLSTGKKVNSALDNPVSYFAALTETTQAGDLTALKDAMNEAVQTVKAANAGISGITDLINTAKGIANAAKSTSDTATRASYATQFDDIRSQIDRLAADSGYNGTNLLNGDTLTVTFNSDASSTLGIVGFTATSAGALAIDASAGSWAANTNVDAAISDLNAALDTLRSNSATLSGNLGIVTARQTFTTSLVNVLVQGANNLTLADTNEEGANMLALQTQQALSSTSLSLAAQSAQSVLRLFQ